MRFFAALRSKLLALSLIHSNSRSALGLFSLPAPRLVWPLIHSNSRSHSASLLRACCSLTWRLLACLRCRRSNSGSRCALRSALEVRSLVPALSLVHSAQDSSALFAPLLAVNGARLRSRLLKLLVAGFRSFTLLALSLLSRSRSSPSGFSSGSRLSETRSGASRIASRAHGCRCSYSLCSRPRSG